MRATIDVIRDSLAEIAPEVDVDALDPDVELRDQVDLDSMDFLNLIQAIADATGIEIPERDYPRVATIAGLRAYLDAHQASAGRA
jgi:acyl carrier protein